jgi:hypothetical protein
VHALPALCQPSNPSFLSPRRSLAEAQAYCRLHSGRLLTEAEWQHVAASAAAASGAVQQLEAGGWEWTSSALRPLPGEVLCSLLLIPACTPGMLGRCTGV